MTDAPAVYLGAPVSDYVPTLTDDLDAYTSKIGGKPAWLRPVVPSIPEAGGAVDRQIQLSKCARCPKCRSAANLRLLTQIYAPLEVFDRVLYLFMCVACSSSNESVVCSFRSLLYNPTYDESSSSAKKAKSASTTTAGSSTSTSSANPPAPTNESLFAVDDDDGWGDDGDDAAPVSSSSPSSSAVEKKPDVTPGASSQASDAAQPHQQEQRDLLVTYPSATSEENALYAAALKKSPLPMLVLDTFLEPEGEKEKKNNKSVAEQLAEIEALHPGITEVSGEAVEADKIPVGGSSGGRGGGGLVVDDDEGPTETPDEVASAEFFARMARCPTQCVRWSPKGQPLPSSATRKPPPANAIPPCSTCGAPRVFEFQLLSPAIYFFEKNAVKKSSGRGDGGASKKAGTKAAKMQTIAAVEGSPSDPHFGTISVYACSANCYDAQHTVTLEYAHLEPEL